MDQILFMVFSEGREGLGEDAALSPGFDVAASADTTVDGRNAARSAFA
jgi:hypothetical protein